MIYKTHQTEHQYKIKPEFVKISSVRSGQTLPLRQLVENAQRGLLPDTVTFPTMDSNGFIPPQYDRSHMAERFNRMKELESEFESMPMTEDKQTETVPTPSSSTIEDPTPPVADTPQ